jgi:hypothetical protein
MRLLYRLTEAKQFNETAPSQCPLLNEHKFFVVDVNNYGWTECKLLQSKNEELRRSGLFFKLDKNGEGKTKSWMGAIRSNR